MINNENMQERLKLMTSYVGIYLQITFFLYCKNTCDNTNKRLESKEMSADGYIITVP